MKNAMIKLYNLSEGKQGQEVMRSTRQGPLFAGAIVAVLRYGHYMAGKMLCKAGVPIRTTLRLVRIAQAQGYQYRQPCNGNYKASLDFTRKQQADKLLYKIIKG